MSLSREAAIPFREPAPVTATASDTPLVRCRPRDLLRNCGLDTLRNQRRIHLGGPLHRARRYISRLHCLSHLVQVSNAPETRARFRDGPQGLPVNCRGPQRPGGDRNPVTGRARPPRSSRPPGPRTFARFACRRGRGHGRPVARFAVEPEYDSRKNGAYGGSLNRYASPDSWWTRRYVGRDRPRWASAPTETPSTRNPNAIIEYHSNWSREMGKGYN